MTPDLVIIGASGAYLRSVKRTEAEILGKYVFDAFPENPLDPDSTDVSEVRASMLRALAKGEPDTTAFVRYAVPVDTPSGTDFEERYWSTVHTPVLDANRVPILVFQNPVDVTELYRFDALAKREVLELTPPGATNAENFNRAQMHEALSRILNDEREHLRSLFNQSPGFVAVLMGPQFVFELVNESYYQLVGHRELIGKPLWDALPEVAGQGFEQILERVYTTGEPFSARAARFEVQRERGGPIVQRYVDLVYQPYKDRYGTTVGIFAQGYDVTDTITAQDAREKSDERLRDGMDAAKMVVWDWNFATSKMSYSENIVHVLGVAPSKIQDVSEYIHPNDREKISAAHKRARELTGSYEEVVRFNRPDNGQQLWVDSRGKVQYDSEGIPTSMRGVTMDVTDRYQAELELRDANRKKDEFLAMLAHELRNPLAPITTAAELLQLPGVPIARIAKSGEVISRQVKHMSNLVDDLLDVSRVTRGLVKLDLEYVDVKSVVYSAVEQSRPLLDSRHQFLTIRTEGENSTVHGDRTRLIQVVANILNNASKYTPQGGEISLSVASGAGWADICIVDNGIGMDEKLLPHVFELFTQGERTPDRAQGGLGIGLALVKTMVTLHGGEVSAHSSGLGRGSKFTIVLPLATADYQENANIFAGVENAKAPALRVMVVDDNVDGAESLAALLEAQGHTVSVEDHPLNAISTARAVRPEVFILDIGLPEIDGYELVRRLRSEPLHRDSIFIALTGYGQAQDRVLSRSAGFHHHFVKPLNFEI